MKDFSHLNPSRQTIPRIKRTHKYIKTENSAVTHDASRRWFKNGGLFHNIPPFCDFVDCHTFTSLICLTQPLTYNLYHYYLKSFLTCHFSLPQGLPLSPCGNLTAKLSIIFISSKFINVFLTHILLSDQ